nr:hypothetical protein [Tanacetum cinerariifolium]
ACSGRSAPAHVPRSGTSPARRASSGTALEALPRNSGYLAASANNEPDNYGRSCCKRKRLRRPAPMLGH